LKYFLIVNYFAIKQEERIRKASENGWKNVLNSQSSSEVKDKLAK